MDMVILITYKNSAGAKVLKEKAATQANKYKFGQSIFSYFCAHP